MKVLVAVKRVVDYNVRIRVKSDGTGVDKDNVVMSMNPFDENSLEEAMQMKEADVASEVIAVSIGDEKSEDTLRSAFAMGADRAILIKTDVELEPLAIAKLLAKVVEQESPQVAILGKQAIDDDSNQTGQMLSAMLGWSQGTFASNAEHVDGAINLTRETDAGLETIKITLPAVITTDLRLNTPRLPKLPAIMKAKKKPIETHEADSFGIDLAPRLEVVSVAAPAERAAGIIVANAAELVEKLKEAEAL
ncbi:electron transfer flavoprotein subunit beta/FixA family protein [Leucothrix arctica]|uniref:Electron transfer flavoprotein subunit beta n=1 Tax=Leucothrix arctica TaxID=1481894 RepID=A0A317CIU0_9GAMM|nr:electron transfer flavoprotein subunit beta/FixA family protein [Leucothrix arctica]PWQ98478.1 electron transfer flavoprotein subunit beta [Leucothrix arctica]